MNSENSNRIGVYSPVPLKIVSKEKRFIHFFTDTLCFFLVILLHAMILDGWLGLIPEGGSPLLTYYAFALYLLYYTSFEYFLGKTPGKYLTKTSVVLKSGKRPSFFTLLARSIIRLIPLEPLSFLLDRRGWHDVLTGTYVSFD